MGQFPSPFCLATDALFCDLAPMRHAFAHPPWGLMIRFLTRLRFYPRLKVLFIALWLDSSPSWPLMLRLRDPLSEPLRVVCHRGMLFNCFGGAIPPPPKDRI